MPLAQDYEFEIGGLAIGLGHPIVCESVDFGSVAVRHQDREAPFTDQKVPGRDQRTPSTWSFNLYTDLSTAEDALAAVEDLAVVWDAAETRAEPGAVLPLRYSVGGRTRVVYGRPGTWTQLASDKTLRSGRAMVTCDFRLVDETRYSDEEFSLPLTLGASVVGGFKTPWKPPIRSLVGGAPRVNEAIVGGKVPTWAVVRIEGAATRPYIQVGTWRVQLGGSVALGQPLTIDPRPWVQSVYTDAGVHLSGMLTPQSRLTQMKLPVGTSGVTFGVDAADGPVTAELTWRTASLGH